MKLNFRSIIRKTIREGKTPAFTGEFFEMKSLPVKTEIIIKKYANASDIAKCEKWKI
jgi:hypothetical protein